MDLKKFKKVSAKKKKVLADFLDKLDELVPEDMQEIVAEADARVWQKTDCTTCANCCKKMTPTFTTKDIARIARHLGMTQKAFKDKWLHKEEDSGDWVNTTQPCQFLIDNKCSIYDVRPVDCAEFPHHNKVPFDAYNDTYKANIEYCPATYSLVNKVRKEVREKYIWPD